MRLQALRVPYFGLRRASLRVGGRGLTRERDFQVLGYSAPGRVSGTIRTAGDGCSDSDFAALRPGEVPLVTRTSASSARRRTPRSARAPARAPGRRCG